ncbi:TPA: hypothetical protein ONA27_004672 [Pseudomonas aeruginosa]|nr:hypothetical protein [Pseudomonas aeruginosa]
MPASVLASYPNFLREYRFTCVDPAKPGQSLVINSGDNGLQLRFDITRSASNKSKLNTAVFEIYNLNQQSRTLMSAPYLFVTLEVGYKGQELITIFSGNITSYTTRWEGTDNVTSLTVGEGFIPINETRLMGTIAPGSTVRDMLNRIVTQMPGIVPGVWSGIALNAPLMSGKALTGAPKEALDNLTRAYDLEWTIADGALHIQPIDGYRGVYGQAVRIAPESGLIGSPFPWNGTTGRKKKSPNNITGLQFKTLLLSRLRPGELVHLVSREHDSYLKVQNIRYYGDYRGQNWNCDIQGLQVVPTAQDASRADRQPFANSQQRPENSPQ